jgi:hypothetical protein
VGCDHNGGRSGGRRKGIASSHTRGWPFVRKPFGVQTMVGLIARTLGAPRERAGSQALSRTTP